MSDALDEPNFSARLLAEEAISRGYQLKSLPQTSLDSHSPIVECIREGKKICFRGTATNLDSSLAQVIVSDKITTNEILRSANLPIPPTFILPRNEIRLTDSEELSDIFSRDTLASVRKFLQENISIVIKPSNTDHGNGVTIGISDESNLAHAIIYAYQKSKDADILMQRMVRGQEFRFLVVNGKTVFVANRIPPSVIGDGKRTLRELINSKNADPRRGERYTSPLTKISLADVAHFIGTEKLDEVPHISERVELLKTSNLSLGGDSINMTTSASHFLKNLAARAAVICGLGIAGVDIITEDISGDSGEIIEVNVSPGLRVTVGEIDIAKTIFDELEKI